ncbi:cupin domain-containing protein [Mucilaginibacter ginkgonis]|uniref:Cupin domain-containing protein n=1 Tax=Mucilaginibacter ginkgonis TaxID=2682091 RepID=A0A6I4I0R0_9SPHI|nr:cupin domain-containing protein [Mucilaginibacter ginkgonis]QQL51146.1 cupin domain-containing protein [Mucilaginibacter ginkgonis]
MNAILSKDKCLSKYTWGDNCTGWNFVDTDDLSVKQELMPARTAEALHYHNKANQFFFILKGTATFEVDQVTNIVNMHQGIEIKAGQKHRVSNESAGDLEFILYSQPSTKNDRTNC